MHFRHWQGWLCLIAVCGLLVSCQPATDRNQATSVPPPAIEPITVYIGALQPAAASTTEDLIAVLVGEQRVRAMVCSLADQRWQTVDTWFGQGERTGTALSASSTARKATITATLQTPQLINGEMQTADGVRYPFQAQRVISTADYEAQQVGSEIVGVYTVSEEPLPDGRLAVMYAAANPAQNQYCGMLLYEGQPVTRVQLKGTWQASFSEFILPDPIGTANQTLVWKTPRHMLRIEGILLPSP